MTWLVIDAAAVDARHLGLLLDRKIVREISHRRALSKPALATAPSIRSFSSVRVPILAYSVLMSIAPVAEFALALLSKTPTGAS